MIVHFTTVHPRTDTRIRIKEVATLARRLDAEVCLYVQDGLGDELDEANGYHVIDTGPRSGRRLQRMTIGAWRMYRAVRTARPEIAHFHDPELLPWALLLRLSGIKVIYDVHEDLPRQILHKHYIPKLLALPLSKLVEILERAAAPALSGIVVVVPEMLSRFPASKTVMVANFPTLDEFPVTAKVKRREMRFVYAGGVTKPRGAVQMVQSIGLLASDSARLAILGNASPTSLSEYLRTLDGWHKVDALGWTDRTVVQFELSRALAGLVVLEPTPQYLFSYPVKMFEYMAAGLPVIASDFPLWREIIGSSGSGLLVDPMDPAAIANAMQWIIDHPDDAEAMGQRGRTAVEERYNWDTEASKLIALYERLSGQPETKGDL